MNNPLSPTENRATPIVFSQSSLQDYLDCRRRFQLRYLLQVRWPALESQPANEHERAMQQGSQFHRLVQQHVLGIPADKLTPLAQGEDLTRWWDNYLDARRLLGLDDLTSTVARPEITLSAPLNGQRLLAKFDLIVARLDGRLTIFDWKTSRKKSQRSWLLDRQQTRLYPYLLAKAGGSLIPTSNDNTSQIAPSQVEMIYWFAEAPRQPEIIPYSDEQFANDEKHLTHLLEEITTLAPENFHKTNDEKRCQYCTYRSLCNRGKAAGEIDEMVEEPEISLNADFDFEQIAEIEF